MTHGRHRLLGLSQLLVAVACVTLAACPRPTAARSRYGSTARAQSSPVDRAVTGGLVLLRGPASTMIRVAGGSLLLGSTDEEVVAAMADCRRERSRGGATGAEAAWPGCREELFTLETPVRRASVAAYWLDRTEVTVAAYARCVELRRCAPLPYAQGARRFARPDHPASLVTWQQANEYCAFRGGRLPTEAEFERAARGRVRRRYPWGNLYNSHACNHGRTGVTRTDSGDGFAELAPVGSFPSGRTPDGFLDLAGNVAEWTSDALDPRLVNGLDVKLIRGGSYESAAPFLRGASRAGAEPTTVSPTLGFRCARRGSGS
jgi:formylglycine-generating enzyme